MPVTAHKRTQLSSACALRCIAQGPKGLRDCLCSSTCPNVHVLLASMQNLSARAPHAHENPEEPERFSHVGNQGNWAIPGSSISYSWNRKATIIGKCEGLVRLPSHPTFHSIFWYEWGCHPSSG